MQEFRLASPPTNKKNSKRAFRGRVVSNPRAKESQRDVARVAREADLDLEPTRDVRLVIEWNLPEGDLVVRLEPMDEPPTKGPTGRGRDIIGLAETIQDALEGIAFGNDAQVADLQVRKVYSDPSEYLKRQRDERKRRRDAEATLSPMLKRYRRGNVQRRDDIPL